MPMLSDGAKVVSALVQGGIAWDNEEKEAAYANFASAGGSALFFGGKHLLTAEEYSKANKQELWILELCILALQLAEIIQLGNANEKGEKFNTALRDFQLALRSLEDAVAQPQDWYGPAADAYNAQNDDQMDRVQLVADLDMLVPAILKTECGQVKKTRAVSTECRVALTGCIPVAYFILANYGMDACLLFQLAAAAAPMGTAISHFWQLEDDVKVNAADVKKLTDEYNRVAAGAADAISVLSGGSPSSTVADAPTSTVGDFQTLSAAPASARYATASDAAPTGSESEGAALFASAVEDDSAGDRGENPDDGTLAPDGETQVPQAYTTPTLSQVVNRASEASTQVAKFSEEAAVSVSLVNDVVGTIDQISSMAADAAPADEPPAADDVEGAAGDAEIAERAPVDVAAGDPEGAQQRSAMENA